MSELISSTAESAVPAGSSSYMQRRPLQECKSHYKKIFYEQMKLSLAKANNDHVTLKTDKKKKKRVF